MDRRDKKAEYDFDESIALRRTATSGACKFVNHARLTNLQARFRVRRNTRVVGDFWWYDTTMRVLLWYGTGSMQKRGLEY